MSYEKFIPEVVAKNIENSLEPFLVFEKDCDYTFEGELKFGGKVKILGVDPPTIYEYTGGKIPEPEFLNGFSTRIDIDAGNTFNYAIEDIDKAFTKKGLMEALTKETSMALAAKRNSYCAKKMATSKLVKVAKPVTFSKPEEAAAAISAGKVYLREKSVITPITAYIGCDLYDKMGDYLIGSNTNNSKTIVSGKLEGYKSMTFKETNTLYKDKDGFAYAILKTTKAFAFASAIEKVEPYRPEAGFTDAVKGLDCYGGGIVRPEEIYVIPYKLQMAGI